MTRLKHRLVWPVLTIRCAGFLVYPLLEVLVSQGEIQYSNDTTHGWRVVKFSY